MTGDALPEAAESYLRALGAELSDAPADTAREIVEDVRAHIADALESGRPLDQTLAGLGSPDAVAAQAREELALPEHSPDRAARLLRGLAVAVGVLTAVHVSFLLPATLPLDSPESGPGLSMLTLLPALLAAAPFALPARTRGAAGLTVAVLLTAFLFVRADLAVHYFPLVLLLWAATIVPRSMRRRRGRLATRLWHLTAGAFLALPGILTVSTALTDKMGITWDGLLLWGAGPLILGALCAYGLRLGYAAASLVGAVVMALAIIDSGFLFMAFWWFGGLNLTIGASGYATARARPRRRAEQRSAMTGIRPDPIGR